MGGVAKGIGRAVGGVGRAVGGIFGGGGGGAGGGYDRPGLQEVKSSSSPWSGQAPFLSDVFRRAQQQSNVPLKQFPGERVVGFAPETEQAFQGITARATAGSPLNRAAQEQIQRTLQSDIISEPQFQRDFSRMARSVSPQINSTFAARGRGRGGGIREAQTRALGDIFSNLYGQERQNQMKAAQFAPILAQQDYADLSNLSAVGSQRESLQQQQLSDAIRRFEFEQNEPAERLRRFAALVSGGSFGSEGTSQIPFQRTPSPVLKNMLGTGIGLAGLFGGDGS